VTVAPNNVIAARFFCISLGPGQDTAPDAPVHPSPAVNSGFVPKVFQEGARPLDVAQVAVLLGWTKDAARAACERGDLAHLRDHLNAYRIACSAVAAARTKRVP